MKAKTSRERKPKGKSDAEKLRAAVVVFQKSAHEILDLMEKSRKLNFREALVGGACLGSFSDTVARRWPAIDARVKELAKAEDAAVPLVVLATEMPRKVIQ